MSMYLIYHIKLGGFKMKQKKRREPAYSRKIGKLLTEDKIKYRGNSDNLKAEMSIMPNLSVTIA